MISIFLDKISNLATNIFSYLFGKDDVRVKSIINIDLSTLKKISKLRMTENGIYYAFDYNNKIISDSIHYIKNKNIKIVAEKISLILADLLLEELADERMISGPTDFVMISIPTSHKHWLRRGFNPSETIATCLSKHMNIKYVSNVLVKSRETPEQKTLKRSSRLVNVINSMEINLDNNDLSHKSVIVIDDIVTTGATLNEAKRVLKSCGVKRIICVALAH